MNTKGKEISNYLNLDNEYSWVAFPTLAENKLNECLSLVTAITRTLPSSDCCAALILNIDDNSIFAFNVPF